jgi:hypothetical protein
MDQISERIIGFVKSKAGVSRRTVYHHIMNAIATSCHGSGFGRIIHLELMA